jgi:hypothetical protein
MTHRQPEDRIYKVLSGVFYIGLGDEFDADRLQAPPGTMIRPLGPEYLSAKDDPRNNNS